VLDPLPLPQQLAVLNRVVGITDATSGVTTITPSQILGRIESDPNIAVYLLNPQGVLFGANSVVQVGSLIASTRNATDASFLSGGTIRFAGTSAAGIEVRSGAQLEAIAATRGIIALIGARIETRGALTASGDIALVAADDATINFDPDSPLAITITEGTALSDPIVARNALTGSSILLAAATRASVTSALLDVQATMSATTAYATDQGIVLAAGPTAATAPGVSFAGAPSGNSGALGLTLGGVLEASGAAGAIDVRARNGVLAPATPARLDADQSVLVRADAGGLTVGNVTSRLVSTSARGVDLSAGSGDLTAGVVSAGVLATAPAAPGSAVRRRRSWRAVVA
jgi:filamentous hemagglutinin family protein